MLDPGTPPATVEPVITLDILEADASTLVESIDMAHVVDGRTEDPIVGDGLGEIALGLETTNRAALTKGRVLRWNGTGDDPFHSLIEENDEVVNVPSHSKVPLQVSVRGRGLIGQWDGVRVPQWPGMEDDIQRVGYFTRHFNAMSPVACEAIDGTVYELGPVLDFDSDGQPASPLHIPPATWRDETAQRISTGPDIDDQRLGKSLFRTTFVPTGTDLLGDGIHSIATMRFHATADDRVIVWCNGVPVLKPPDAPEIIQEKTYASTVRLEGARTYDFVLAYENELPPSGWVAFAAYSVVGLNSTLEFHTDSSWTGLECIDIPLPGWIVPDILSTLLAEWQNIGALTGWEVVDMTPGDWEPMIETNFEVNRTTGLGVIQQLADGQAEFATRVRAGVKQLLCFAPGTMGTYHTSPADPPELADANIADLSFSWVQS